MAPFYVIIILNITLAVLNAVFPADPVAPEMLAILEQHIQAQEHIGTVEELPKYPWNIDFLIQKLPEPINNINPSGFPDKLENNTTTNLISQEFNANENLAESQNNQEHLADINYSSAEGKESRINLPDFEAWMHETLTAEELNETTDKSGHINMPSEILEDFISFCKTMEYNEWEIDDCVNQIKNATYIEIIEDNQDQDFDSDSDTD